MSFACDACNKAVPVGKRSDWIDRCPWCGGPVTFLGLKAVSAADSTPRKPTKLRHGTSSVRRSQPAGTKQLPEWVAWAGAIVFLLLVLLGTCLYLASTLPAKPAAGPELAVADSLTAAELEQPVSPPAELRQTEGRKADASTPPIREAPSAPKIRQEPPPSPQQPKAQEPAPSEPPRQPQGQAPLGQEQKPQEQKPSGSLLDLLPDGKQSGQQPGGQAGAAPGGVKPLAPGGQPKDKPAGAIFMGVKAEGKRICIIADCSGSMAFNNRMNRLKLELWKTVKGLTPDQEFYVVYFSDTAIPMRPQKWYRADKLTSPPDKFTKGIRDFIGAQPPGGGTEPMPAFQVAFRLKPRPDAIFFLTDGLIPLTVPQGVARLNGTGKDKVPIHTILFGGELPNAEMRIVMVPMVVRGKTVMVRREIPVGKMEKDQGQLEQVSRDSGGTHRFIPDEGKARR
jgi:hypothetical protein